MPSQKDMILLTIKKGELDRANKDEANRLFSPNFRVSLTIKSVFKYYPPKNIKTGNGIQAHVHVHLRNFYCKLASAFTCIFITTLLRA